MKPIFSIIIILLAVTSCKKNNNTNPGPTTFNLKLVVDNMVSPLTLAEPPDATKRLFVLDQPGKIWIIQSDGSKVATPFMDLSSKMVGLNGAYDERGLLGLAFHPDFKNNGKFYVFYTAPPHLGGPAGGGTWNSLIRISEFKVSTGNANLADMSSERVILESDHPQGNHNGGTI